MQTSHEDNRSAALVFPSSFGPNALPGHPAIEVRNYESHPGPCQFDEGNTAFLDQSSNESLRAAQSVGGAADV